LQASCPEIEIVGAVTKRLPHTTNIAFIGVEREAMLIALDLAGIACSTGSACASGSSDPSPTLVAMGCRGAVLASALRFSFGRTTTAADVADGAMRIAEIYKDLRAKNSPAKLPPGHRTTTADRL
jgi:cysteine desulfurase